MKRRLLQLKEESVSTFAIPSVRAMEEAIIVAKSEAIVMARKCNLSLDRYLDEDLYFHANDRLIESAVINDFEVDESREQQVSESVVGNEDVVTINEDISNINLVKTSSSGIPKYTEASKSSTKRNYLKNQKGRSCFVEYNGVYIRKTTALYLLQEKNQLSNDRLLRVRSAQPTHLFNSSNEIRCQRQELVESGDLCAFKQEDSEKVFLGRTIQFSYLEGTKKEREYSSTYVDVSCESFKSIGVFCNWFRPKILGAKIIFYPLEDMFTIGYHPMVFYVSTIDPSALKSDEEGSFAINLETIKTMFPEWDTMLCFDF